jgi:Gpi18-like mannosyltransferase
MKLFIIVFDSLIAVLIYKSGSCRSRVPSFASKSLHFVGLKASEATLGSPSLASPAISTLIYALSPIPVLLGSFFGQFDAIPLFFLLLGIFLASKKRFSWGLFSLGLGTCFKPWVFLFVPMVLWREKNWADRGKLLTFYFLPLFIITLLYILLIPSGDIINMLKGIGLYISVAGWWGPSVFFGKLAELFAIPRLLTIPSQISKVVTVGLIFYLAIKLKNKNIYQAAKLTILAIYIFSFGFAIQYLVWILPFLLITRDKRLKYYLIFVGLYYLIFGTTRILNYNFQPPQIPEIFYYSASFFLWLFFVKWGIKEKRSVELR